MTDKTIALLRSLFATDEKGNIFLRVAQGEPKGELKNAVNTQSNRSFETLLSNAVALDTDGNPCLVLAEVNFGKTILEADKERVAKMQADKKAREKAEADQRAKARAEAEAKAEAAANADNA